MAKIDWVNLSAISGTNTATIQVSSTPFTGRVSRRKSLYVNSRNDPNQRKILTVIQSANSLTLSKTSGDTSQVIPKTGGSAKWVFVTNAKYFGMYADSTGKLIPFNQMTYDPVGVTNPSLGYPGEGNSTIHVWRDDTSAAIIDPGATGNYTINVSITFGANTSGKVSTLPIYFLVSPSDSPTASGTKEISLEVVRNA